jgi:hypothetical protein
MWESWWETDPIEVIAHAQVTFDWVASVRGTGFVSACSCGWESAFHKDRAGAVGEADAHNAPLPAKPRRRPRLRVAPAAAAAVVPAP